MLWLLLLFRVLGSTAEDFFSPILTHLAQDLSLPPRLAGGACSMCLRFAVLLALLYEIQTAFVKHHIWARQRQSAVQRATNSWSPLFPPIHKDKECAAD